VGCNWFGADWADEDTPGSAPCSPGDPKNLDSQIAMIQQLRAEGYLPIATLQYAEFYFYEPTAQQARDFAALRDAGAVVVNGSQGHHVQGFDISAEGFIHWGTGNFFFGDQIFSDGTLQSFVDRHVFYDNKYLGVDLRTAWLEDLAQPVPMPPEDRAKLLTTLFDVSRFR
jgi:poly-gamma-glutamate synthesis protein (capsule biosynthesis protein)